LISPKHSLCLKGYLPLSHSAQIGLKNARHTAPEKITAEDGLGPWEYVPHPIEHNFPFHLSIKEHSNIYKKINIQ
jgi:hypothetical protein